MFALCLNFGLGLFTCCFGVCACLGTVVGSCCLRLGFAYWLLTVVCLAFVIGVLVMQVLLETLVFVLICACGLTFLLRG